MGFLNQEHAVSDPLGLDYDAQRLSGRVRALYHQCEKSAAGDCRRGLSLHAPSMRDARPHEKLIAFLWALPSCHNYATLSGLVMLIAEG